MKTKLLFLLLPILWAINLEAQIYQFKSICNIKPTLVKWEADGRSLSLKNAKQGIIMPQKLTIAVYIDTIKLKNKKDFSLEFRWYYYLSTRRKLMDTRVIPLNKAQKVGAAYLFKCTKTDLTKGWWEVEIYDTKKHSILKFAQITNFQIFLK